MARRKRSPAPHEDDTALKTKNKNGNGSGADFAPQESAGYLVRDAHRAFQHLLEKRIAPYGVTRGQWYFLRVLWTRDGVSQRELSESVGMMEPTTVIALQSMEKAGLVRRERSTEDKRKAQVWLTPKAKKLKSKLLPVARHITMQARDGVTHAEFELFRDVIRRMTANLDKVKR